ncbi:MAG TPA: hypothetical protein VIC85_22050 [Ktedonobacterales bacterium]
MRAHVVLLAVTLMKTGVCIAGVQHDAPSTWLRPVRDFGSILLGDITYPPTPATPASSGTHPAPPAPRDPSALRPRHVMRPFDIAAFDLAHARHTPPHAEDWACDFVHQRPRLIGVLPESDRAALLDAAATDPAALWSGSRSLGALAVDTLTATFRHDPYSGKYDARLAFLGLPDDTATAACTDLKWRALGRRLLAAHTPPGDAPDAPRTLTLSSDRLWEALGGPRRCWLALGISRAYDGRHWPLVVGVHTIPDYEAEVDYNVL